MYHNLVSVIIPVYNDSARLLLCLEALKLQSLGIENFEVLVVDNNSKEDISAVVDSAAHENIKYLKEIKIGSYAARNAGIAAATGEIIAFTDSDCIPQKDWLKEGIACLTSSENPGVVGGKITLFFKGNKPNFVEIYEKYTAFRQAENIATGTCVGANWFSYKSVLAQFGNFNSALKSGGDTELSGRMSRNGYTAYFCEQALILHPSRFNFKEIGTKYARIFGGKLDRQATSKLRSSLAYIAKFIFRRLKWNLKMVFQIPFRESFALFIVNLYIFVRLMREASRLVAGKDSERL